jgi:hyaluronan synthase
MFIRWARSNVRETIAMAAFAFGRFRDAPAAGARVNLIQQGIGMFVTPVLMIVASAGLAWYPAACLLNILLGTAISSCVPACFYALRVRSANALWAFPYGLLWVLALAWINPFSMLTPHKSGWLTRQIKRK